MESVKNKNSKSTKKSKAPLVVNVKTSNGNNVSVKQITPSEIKALRNAAYKYLA